MSLTSVELNHLVWRYLQESGHEMAAYALEKSARCRDENLPTKALGPVGPGALVSLVQKGILYTLAHDAAAGDAASLTLAHALAAEAEKNKLLEAKNATELAHTNTSANTNINTNTNTNTTTNGDTTTTTNSNTNTNGDANNFEDTNTEVASLAAAFTFAPAFAALWHPAGGAFAFGRENGAAAIQTEAGEPLVLNHAPSDGDISTVAWSPSGTVVTAGGLGELRAWGANARLKNVALNSASDARADPLDSHAPALSLGTPFVALSWGPHWAATVDANNAVCVWDASLSPVLQVVPPTLPLPDLASHPLCVCWLGDLKLAVSTPSHSIQIYSVLRSGSSLAGQLAGHAHAVSALTFSPVSKLLASASDTDYAIKVWNSLLPLHAVDLNVHSDRTPHIYYHTTPVLGLFFLASGNHLASVSMEGSMNVWDAVDGSVLLLANIFLRLAALGKHDTANGRSMVFAAALAPSLAHLAVADDSGNVSVWDVDPEHYGSRVPLRCVGYYAALAEEADVCDLAWDPRGSFLAVCYRGRESVVLEVPN